MRKLCLFLIVVSGVAAANVTGPKSEVYGTQWRQRTFASWLLSPDAIVTPEVTRLATQACFRRSQEALDVAAYHVARGMLADMRAGFRRESANETTRVYDIGLAALTELLGRVEAIAAASPREYRERCQRTVGETFSSPARRDELEALYAGRLRPQIAADLPPEIAAKLAAMNRKGIRLAPLTWEGLRDQICTLEGYYSTSMMPEHWKFFSTTRAMANVLPRTDGEAAFKAAVERAPAVVRAIEKLNRYSSVAGKHNGPSIGAPGIAPSVRMTGVALGTKTTALMALFTTAWRENVQRYVIEQEYPEKPFALIPATRIARAIEDTHREVAGGRATSQTELGIAGLWDSFLFWLDGHTFYGGLGEDLMHIFYRPTAALAWLAMNAEANIRQNEKITGWEKSSGPSGNVTAPVYGHARQFLGIVKEIDAALDAYAAVDPMRSRLPSCVPALRQLNERAARAMAAGQTIATLEPKALDPLLALKMDPVIADIGLEVKDELGDKPEGTFRLHLATGYGREVPIRIRGRSFTVWTPSAMVLHLDRIVSTAEWKRALVGKFDPRAEE